MHPFFQGFLSEKHSAGFQHQKRQSAGNSLLEVSTLCCLLERPKRYSVVAFFFPMPGCSVSPTNMRFTCMKLWPETPSHLHWQYSSECNRLVVTWRPSAIQGQLSFRGCGGNPDGQQLDGCRRTRAARMRAEYPSHG